MTKAGARAKDLDDETGENLLFSSILAASAVTVQCRVHVVSTGRQVTTRGPRQALCCPGVLCCTVALSGSREVGRCGRVCGEA